MNRYNPKRDGRKYYSPKRDGPKYRPLKRRKVKEAIIFLEDETTEVKNGPIPNIRSNVQSETT